MPPDWDSLTYPVRWRGLGLRVMVTKDRVEIAANPDNDGAVSIVVSGTPREVAPGAVVTV